MTLEEQLIDVDIRKGVIEQAYGVCNFMWSYSATCKAFRSEFACIGCIGEIPLSSLREIEPELTESNFKDTIRIHVVLRG